MLFVFFSKKTEKKGNSKSKKKKKKTKEMLRKKEKTIRKVINKNTPQQQFLANHFQKTLGFGDLTQVVQLPPGENKNEWIAMNTFFFFTEIQLLYESVLEKCTDEECPSMVIGEYECKWMEKKELIDMTAQEYIDKALDFCQTKLNDEKVFPCDSGKAFPKKFNSIVLKMFKFMFRVYGHIYTKHMDSVVELEEEKHLNSSFKQFLYFAAEFELLSSTLITPLECVLLRLTPELLPKFKK